MRLFKYFGPDRLSILQTRLIRFSQPSAFNDPFEFLPNIDSIDTPENVSEAFRRTMEMSFEKEYEALDASIRSKIPKDKFRHLMQSYILVSEQQAGSVLNQFASHAQEKINEVANQHMGVLCLSERHDDLLMWAHYADCHRGFVIEFDPDSPFFHQRRSDKDELRHLRAVNYRKERPAITLADTNMSEVFLTKSEHWEYEKEWRMVVALADADELIPNGGENISLFRFPAEAIKSVFVGARMQADTFSALIKSIEGDSSLEHLTIFKSKIHSTTYSLVFEAVDRE
ncbi:DUF2971 domain-containing protein [Pseudomonas tolaasii]|uniref:DUF2971 domain-containing protein n=1 Tax=Pseudomonas tolaasii TaxID=29442 RepID=UPI0015A1BDB4|nr:DUF2971 domain-containing protein [Pseudomonas tolaasii]NVZ48577.1 DUF2971 domain-containing protein [Pseudomonas tolaasii]NWA48883.1 DUF2971 domain-containing protein [Pseudomonas tolaasii]